jgi:hypothetical protein
MSAHRRSGSRSRRRYSDFLRAAPLFPREEFDTLSAAIAPDVHYFGFSGITGIFRE